jgi:mannose-1-phosphate guanylyltransferase/mannose-6-phosphate isomerase
MYDDCVVMAGGSGTRLWPLSNSRTPKQFLTVPSGKKDTFFTLSLERAFSITKEDGKIIIIAGKNHVRPIIGSCAEFDESRKKRILVIPEPSAKNTAAAVFCALVFLEKIYCGENRKIFVLPSDHLIEPQDLFTAQALDFLDHIEKENIAVFGVQPSAPETGFGYIEINNIEKKEKDINKVLSFHEKPDRETAEKYIQSGNFFWNSGMFAFSTRFITQEFLKLAPDIAAPFEKVGFPNAHCQNEITLIENWDGLAAAYAQIKKISFDFAVVTKCAKVIMSAARFQWRDVGCWDEYASLAQQAVSSEENIFRINSENTFVDSDIPVALCGADDLIVVVRSGKGGALPSVLIAKKGETQKVGAIVDMINAQDKKELL